MVYLLLPAYNEEDSLDLLIPKVLGFFATDKRHDHHIIICNDGSTDTTLAKAEALVAQGLPVSIINHKLNRGLGETIRDLFERAAEISKPGDIIIRMDCDDTHEPESIKGLIDKIEEGNDVVVASRFVEGGGQEGLSAFRKNLSLAANYFMKMWFPIKGQKEYSSGFRAYKAEIIKEAIDTFGNAFIQLKGMGFSCTLEKIVKLRILNAKFAESPMILRYDQKVSESKMVGSITTLGYIMLVILYYWPYGGWRSQYKSIRLKKK